MGNRFVKISKIVKILGILIVGVLSIFGAFYIYTLVQPNLKVAISKSVNSWDDAISEITTEINEKLFATPISGFSVISTNFNRPIGTVFSLIQNIPIDTKNCIPDKDDINLEDITNIGSNYTSTDKNTVNIGLENNVLSKISNGKADSDNISHIVLNLEDMSIEEIDQRTIEKNFNSSKCHDLIKNSNDLKIIIGGISAKRTFTLDTTNDLGVKAESKEYGQFNVQFNSSKSLSLIDKKSVRFIQIVMDIEFDKSGKILIPTFKPDIYIHKDKLYKGNLDKNIVEILENAGFKVIKTVEKRSHDEMPDIDFRKSARNSILTKCPGILRNSQNHNLKNIAPDNFRS